MAEIPTLQRKPDVDRDGDGTVSPPSRARTGRPSAAGWPAGLHVRVDRCAVALAVRLDRAHVPSGPGRARRRCGSSAGSARRSTPPSGAHAARASTTRTTRAAPGGTSSPRSATAPSCSQPAIPTATISARLTKYPTDRLESPLDQRHGARALLAGWRRGTGTAVARDGDRIRRARLRRLDRVVHELGRGQAGSRWVSRWSRSRSAWVSARCTRSHPATARR